MDHGQTDSCQRGGERPEGKKGKGAAKEHACLTGGHGQQCGEDPGNGSGGGWRQAKGRKVRTSVIVSITKKLKNRTDRECCDPVFQLLVTCDQSQWKYLHHSNWQQLKARCLFHWGQLVDPRSPA